MSEENKNVEKTTEATAANEKKKSGKMKYIIITLLTLLLGGGAAAGIFFVWNSAGYLTTDNARVTTTRIYIAPNIPGTLERFTIYEGRYVGENEILGWVENDSAMRSPVDGLVVHTDAVQGQAVSPMQPIAVIADIGNIHISANIEETDIGRLEIGQPAMVTIDPFGNQQFNGYIAEIGSITAAELAGTTMFFNTGGTFVRPTHLLPVRINITDDVNLDNFIGVNARVRIPVR
ncbi:MAG: efflux RND transporter periplasmic adaptor subunit [Defluviitaleaceae bacterium]|nr:efflux RND transporter periplasmic adaptor subunit [Defluviitaleaceae bacterium]